MKKVQFEQKEQEAVIQWFRLCHPRIKYCLTASMNGGKRDIKEAARMKKMGLTPGEPDLFLSLIATPVIDQQYKFLGGLYIELKSEKGKLTKSQKEIIKLRVDSGYQVAVCHSAEDAIQVIKDYLQHAVVPGSPASEQLRSQVPESV